MRRLFAGLLAILLIIPVFYDAVGFRMGPRSTFCRRTLHSSSAFWGDGEVGEELDITGSSDVVCGSCDETFQRRPRLVLKDVESPATVVQPCRPDGS